MILRLTVFVIAFGFFTNAVPVTWDDSKCSQECSGGYKYKYSPGEKYIYSYASSNELQAEEASDLMLKLEATFSITVISQCELVLEITDITVHHGPETLDSSSSLIAGLKNHPLPFSFDDGKISHICPSPDDSDEINNIKKAILSAFQNTMRTFEFDAFNIETDILGSCDTEYKAKENGIEKYEIMKIKNIPTCSNHIKGKSILLASFYSSSANQQHLPILSDEKSSCKQVINSGIVEEVSCDEEAYFKPLSEYGLVFKAIGSIKIKLLRSESASLSISYRTPVKESLTFKFDSTSSKTENVKAEAEQIVQYLCENSKDAITKDAASYLHQLVYKIRQLDSKSVENIYIALKNGEICSTGKKGVSIYLDALRRASSGGSISLLSKLAVSGELSFYDALIWTTMLPFTSYVEEESIAGTIPLLEKKPANRQFLLGSTALAYKYCKMHPDCQSSQAIKDMASSLKLLLGEEKCQTQSLEEESQAITVLKAFGNLGYFEEVSANVLDCALTPTNKLTIRIAAIEAFRRSSCTEEITSQILEIYSSKTEIDELRIAALISLSRCSSRKVTKKVIDVYSTETSKQVEVFTWSFLENLRTTSDPSKAKIQDFLSRVSLHKPSSTDITKFSRNFEWSFFSQVLNLGHVLEGNVIRSAESFVPRSGELSLKLDIFGNELELLKIGGRVEGLEHTLEKIFGPTGIFSDVKVEDLLQGNFKRHRRSLDSYQAKIDALTERFGYSRSKIPHGTAFFQIMGHELALFHMIEESVKHLAGIKVNDLLKKLSDLKEIDLSKNLFFVDVSAFFPSITGWAYKLAVNGSASLGFKALGKIDLQQPAFPKLRSDIDARFQPSFLGEITAAFTIHSQDFEPGVKSETILNADLDFNAKLEVKDGRIFHLKLDRKKQKQDIFRIKRTLYVMNHKGQTEMSRPDSYNLNYCTKYMQDITGSKYCASLSIPHLYQKGKLKVPLCQAMEAALTVEQIDPSIKGYEIYLEIPQISNQTEKNFKFLIDTPNSSKDRKISIEVNFKHPDDNTCSLTASFHSPIYSLNFNADMLNQKERMRFTAEAIGNNTRKYALNVNAVKVVKGARLVEYQPEIAVHLPSTTPVYLNGTVVFSRGRKEQLSFNLESKSFASKFIIKGNLAKEGEAINLSSNWKLNYEINANAISQIHRVQGGIGYTVGQGLAIDLGHHYEPDGRSYESITINAKVQNIQLFDHLGFSIDSKILFADHEDLNSVFKWDFSLKPLSYLKSDLIFRYGKNLEDDNHMIRMTVINALHGDLDNFLKMNIENKVGLTISCLNFDKSASFIVVWNLIELPKVLIEAGIKTQKDKEIKFEFDYKHLQSKPLKLETKITYASDTYKFKYRDEANEISPGEYKWMSFIEPKEGKNISADFVYHIKSSEEIFYHEIDGLIQFPNFPVKQAGSLKIARGKEFNFHSRTDLGRGASYDLAVHVERGSKSEIKVATPLLDGFIKVNVGAAIHTIEANFQSNTDDRNMIITGKITPEDSTTTLDLDVEWTAKDSPKKIYIQVISQKDTDGGSDISGSINYASSINIDISGKINNDLLRGPHFFRIALSGEDAMEPIAIEIDHVIKDGHMNSVTRYLRSGVEKIRSDLKGKFIRHGFNHLEIELGIFLHSPYKTFNDKLAFIHLLIDSNDLTRLFLSEYRFKFSQVIGYEGKINYERKRGWPGSIHSNLIITVHNRTLYEGIGNVEYKNGKYLIQTSFIPITKKKTHFLASFEHSARFVSLQNSFITNMQLLHTIDLNAVADLRNLENAKIHTHFDLNEHKLFNMNSTLKMRTIFDFDVEATLYSKVTPSLQIYSKSQTSGQIVKYNFNLDVESKSVLSGNGELKKKKRGFNSEFVFMHAEKEFLLLSVNQDGKGKHERNYQVTLKFASQVFSANIKSNKDKKGTLLQTHYETKFCRNEELCFEIDCVHKEHDIGNQYIITYKRGPVHFSIERIRQSSIGVERYYTVIFNGEKRYGYDVKFGVEDAGRSLSLGLILPSREIITKTYVEFSFSKPRVKFETSLDGRNHPEKKLITDFQFENHLKDDSPSNLKIIITHPVFEKPIEIDLSVNYEGSSSKFLTAEATMDYSNDSDTKLLGKISFEKYPNNTCEMLMKLYHKDIEHQDFQIKVNGTSNGAEDSFGIFYYWKEENVEKEAYLIASYPKEKKMFFFIYERPKISYRLDGTITSESSILNDTCEVQLKSSYNGVVTTAKLVSDNERGCHKLTIFDNDEVSRIIDICSNFHSRKWISLITNSYDEDGNWAFDYLFEIVQKSWNTIGIRTQANPEFLGKYIFLLTSLGDELEESGVGTLPFYNSAEFKTIRQSLTTKIIDPARKYLVLETGKLIQDLQTDTLLAKDILFNYFKQLPSIDVQSRLQELWGYIKAAAKPIYMYYEDRILQFLQFFNNLQSGINEKCNAIDECKTLVFSYQNEGISGLLKELKALILSIPGKIDLFLENPHISAEVKNFFQTMLDGVKYVFNRLSNNRCGELIVKVSGISYDALEPQLQLFLSNVPIYYRQVKEKLSSNVFLQQCIVLIQESLSKLKEEVLNNYVKLFLMAKQYLEDYLSTLSPPNLNKYFTLNVNYEKGVADLGIHLNVGKRLLNRVSSSLIGVSKKLVHFGQHFNWNTLLVKVKRVLNLQFIPPYDAQAMIIENQHFVTFDKVFYDFAGECTYLLSRDFEDGNWTVALKEKESNVSILIFKGDTSIELNSGPLSTVKAGDQEVDLPFLSKDIIVTREDTSIVVNTLNGLEVECNVVWDICHFHISGYYYGKTAGLFGTYNYEQFDDFKRPKGQIANSVTVFAKSWELKKGCKTVNLVQEVSKKNEYYKQCKALFEARTSVFAACFDVVPPTDYFNLCMRLLSKKSKGTYCNAAAAYAMACEENFVQLILPAKCLTCIGPDGSKLNHGDRKKFEKLSTKSTDTIFIIEDHECNKAFLSELGHLARSIDKELQSEGFRDNLFGVVGFSGDIGDPKVFTVKEKVLFGSRDINGIPERFKLKSKKHESKAFESMKLAITNLFRSNVIKSIILLSCSACKYDYTSLQYPVIQQIFLERSISLHIIQDNEISIRKSASKEKQIIGMDPDTVYHVSDVTQQDLVGDPSLRSHVVLKKDLCVALSQDVNGSLFTSYAMTTPSEMKNWRNVFARKFLKTSLGHLSPCQWCDCTTKNYSPNTICRPCQVKRPRLPFSVGSLGIYSRTVEAFLSYILHVLRE